VSDTTQLLSLDRLIGRHNLRQRPVFVRLQEVVSLQETFGAVALTFIEANEDAEVITAADHAVLAKGLGCGWQATELDSFACYPHS
jgi:hypothetical protein